MPKPENFQVGSTEFIVTQPLQKVHPSCQDFLDKLAGRVNAKFTFVAFDGMKRFKEVLQPDGSIKKVPTHPYRAFYGTLSQHAPTLVALNGIGYDIFVTVQETSSTKREIADIGKTRALYVDRDGSQGLPSEWHLQPSMVVCSSPGNNHPYWLLQEPVQLTGEEFKANIIPLIAHYNGDEQCKDLPRVLRLPGFFNNKAENGVYKYGKPFLVTIHSLTDNRYTLEQIQNGLNPVEISKKHSNYTKKTIVPVEKKLNVKSDLNSQEKLDLILDKYQNILANSQQGTIHNTLLKSCKSFAGLVSFHCPERLNEYKNKFHNIASNLECQGIWNVVSTTHDTIDWAFNKGALLPWDFLGFYSKNTSLLDLNPNIVKLKNGQTLTVKQDLIHKPTGEIIGIAIAEKPIDGYYTIGINNKDLLADIDSAKNENPTLPALPVTIFPTAGWARKKADKLHEIAKLVEFTDYKIYDNNSNSFGSNKPDFNWNVCRYLTPTAWLKKYQPVFDKYQIFQRHFDWKNNLVADIVTYNKYLQIPHNIEELCDFLAIKAPFGNGKTIAMIDKTLLQNKLDTITFTMLLSYRNSLNQQTISRANAKGLRAESIKIKAETQEGSIIDFVLDPELKFVGGCIDSHRKLKTVLETKEKYSIIIDEINSVLLHMLNGGTLKGSDKEKAIDFFKQAINGASFVQIMDANLNNDIVNLFRQLFPSKRIKVLENRLPEDEFKARTFYFLESGTKEENYSTGGKYLASSLFEKCKECVFKDEQNGIFNNERFVFISDSQKKCEELHETLKKIDPNLKIIRIDSTTSGEPDSKEFLENPDEYIKNYQIDVIIMSPSAESGVSIDIRDYFSKIFYCITHGSSGIDGLTQHAFRVRDTNVPVYISCPSFINFGNEINNVDAYIPELPYYAKNFVNVMQENIDNYYQNVNSNFSVIESVELLKESFDRMLIELQTNPLIHYTIKQSAKIRYEQKNLRLGLIMQLETLGHKCIDLQQESNPEDLKELKQTSEAVLVRKSEKIFNSADITLERAELLKKGENNYDVQCQIKRSFLKNRELPGIENTESWRTGLIYATLKHDRFLHKYWRLEQLKNLELSDALFKIGNTNKLLNFAFNPLDILKDERNKIDVYRKLNILKFVEMESFTTKEADSLAQEIVKKVYDDNLWALLKIPKVPKNKGYVNTVFKKLLDYFGLDLTEIKERRTKHDRYYKVSIPTEFEPFIKDIESCFKTRSEQIITEAKERIAEYENKVKERFEQQQLNPYHINKPDDEQISEFETRVKLLEQSLPIIKLSELYIELDGELPENIKNSLQDDEILAIHRIATQKAGEKLLAEF